MYTTSRTPGSNSTPILLQFYFPRTQVFFLLLLLTFLLFLSSTSSSMWASAKAELSVLTSYLLLSFTVGTKGSRVCVSSTRSARRDLAQSPNGLGTPTDLGPEGSAGRGPTKRTSGRGADFFLGPWLPRTSLAFPYVATGGGIKRGRWGTDLSRARDRPSKARSADNETEKEWLSGLELSAFLLKCFARTTQRRGDALACD